MRLMRRKIGRKGSVMAKAKKSADARGKGGGEGKTPSMLMSVLAFVIITVVGAGAGAFHGMQVAGKLAPAHAEEPNGGGAKAGGKKSDAEVAGQHAVAPTGPLPDNAGGRIFRLKSIITNLAAPNKAWVRLEASIVLKGEPLENVELLTGKVSDDIVAFLRTVRLSQIEGPSGFQYLREDLSERAKIRSKGKISELVIRVLIVE